MNKDNKKIGSLIFWIILLFGCCLIAVFGTKLKQDRKNQDAKVGIDTSGESEIIQEYLEQVPSGVISEE